MTDTDPILRAVSDGNTACPDGRALARLGELVRRHSTLERPVDVVADVRLTLEEDDAESDAAPDFAGAEADAIDALYDGSADASVDPGLAALRGLVAAIPLPRPVDLTAAVRARLATADRQPDMPQLQRGHRWRLWSAVAIAHVAAVVLVSVLLTAYRERDANADRDDGSLSASLLSELQNQQSPIDPGPTLPSRLPSQWSEIQTIGTDLFLLRRFPELREETRRHYGLQPSHDAVVGGLTWLQGAMREEGTFGELSGFADRDLATQSLAALALLGEGLGDPGRLAVIRKSLGWIGGELAPERISEHGPIPIGIACLAQVEGALLLSDAAVRAQAETTLAALDRGVPVQAGAAGLGGFTLLAVETAHQGGLRVPGRLLEQSRRNLARSIPAQEGDAGRVGLAAFSRLIYGFRGQASTSRQIAVLGTMLPSPSASGQTDPLSWFFATLALREAGGSAWDHWVAALQPTLVDAFQPVEGGGMRVPAVKVRYANGLGGDVFATSLAVLNLQAGYRYLPLNSK